MQSFLWENWRKESLVTKSFNHCYGYVIQMILFSIEKLKEFCEFLSAFQTSIKFDMDYSPYQIYLDVLITKDESGKILRTRLHTKPTNTHQYLHAQSFLCAVYKKSITFSQAVRLKQICSEEEGLQHKLGDVQSWLVNRGTELRV